MMRRHARILAAALSIVLLCGSAAGAVDGNRMEVYFTDITRPGWEAAIAQDISDTGRVVGYYLGTGGTVRGFLKKGRSYRTVHPSGWESSRLNHISPDGLMMIGSGRDGASTPYAFLYDGSTYTTLTPPGFAGSTGEAVNAGGEAVGYESNVVAGPGYLYSGGAYTIFNVPGATRTMPRDINAAGTVVGSSETAGVSEAFRYSGGALSNPAPPGWTNTRAQRINDRGDILGAGNDGFGDRCWLSSGGVFRALSPPGTDVAVCFDLSESGAVSGIGLTYGGEVATFVYHKGSYYFAEDNPADFFYPLGISRSWELAGGRIMGRGHHAYILPTPAITASGKDGTVLIDSPSPVKIGISLKSWWGRGRSADWWLIAQTPSGLWYFDLASLSWRPGFLPSAGAPLRDMKGLKIPGVSNSPGVYTYYFGVDLIANGVLDFQWWLYDRVTVFVR